MAPVLKTGVPERVPGVRIPPSPPFILFSAGFYVGDTFTGSQLNRFLESLHLENHLKRKLCRRRATNSVQCALSVESSAALIDVR
jgi:hypothetical protein